MSSVVVTCPSCAKPVRMPEHLAGKPVRCPSCKSILHVPVGDPTEVTPEPEPTQSELGQPPDPLADLASAAEVSQRRLGSRGRRRSILGRVLTLIVMLATLAGAVVLAKHLYNQAQQ